MALGCLKAMQKKTLFMYLQSGTIRVPKANTVCAIYTHSYSVTTTTLFHINKRTAQDWQWKSTKELLLWSFCKGCHTKDTVQ